MGCFFVSGLALGFFPVLKFLGKAGFVLIRLELATYNWLFAAANNGLLLFGASDGNFYALHLNNGTLAWKTHVDAQNIMAGQNLPAMAKSVSSAAVSPVQLDPQNQTAFWAFAVTLTGVNGENGNDKYLGVLCSLDVANGNIKMTSQFANNGSVSSSPPKTPSMGLALQNNAVTLTAGNDVWVIGGSTGSVLGMQHFYHYVLQPVESDDQVIVATDLYLIAYNTAEALPEFSSFTVLALLIALTLLAMFFFKKKNKPTDVPASVFVN